MPDRDTHRSLPKSKEWQDKANFFDPSKYKPGDLIAFHNPNTNRWQKGRLAETPKVPVHDRDSRRIYIQDNFRGEAMPYELKIPPRVVDKEALRKEIEIRIEDKERPGEHSLVKYHVLWKDDEPIWNVGPDGEIEVNLVPVDPGIQQKEISNVNIETLINIQKIEEVESVLDDKVESLRAQIDAINDFRKKDLLLSIHNLEKSIRAIVDQAGHFDEMGDIEIEKIEFVASQIAELRRKAEDELRVIQADFEKLRSATTVNPDVVAAGLARKNVADNVSNRIKREHGQVDADLKEYEADKKALAAYLTWNREKDAYDQWVAADKPKPEVKAPKGEMPDPPGTKFRATTRVDGSPLQPDDPIRLNKPEGSKEEAINAGKVFDKLKATSAGTKAVYEPHREIVKEVEKILKQRKIDEGVTGDFEPADMEQRIKGQIFLEVLEKAKKIGATSEFPFDKEKDELTKKVAELVIKADKTALKNKEFEAQANALRAHLDTLNLAKAKTDDIQKILIDIWNDVNKIEIELFREDIRTSSNRSEQEKDIDVDLPPNLLMEIFRARAPQVHAVMSEAYNNQMDGNANMRGGIETGLRKMFELAPTQGDPRRNSNLTPDADMITRLRRYGIKDWRHFKDLWDEKLVPIAAEKLQAWTQDDVTNEIARMSSQWTNANALRGQLAARMGINLVLVGGAVIGTSMALATAGMGALALAAVAGSAGGLMRGVLQKFVFGSDKFENDKEEKLKVLANDQRRQSVENLLTRRFGANHANNPTFEQGTMRMFASLIAEAARESSANFVSTDKIATDAGLSGDSRRIYIESVKDVENGGDVPTEKQKLDLAIAIKKLQERSVGSIKEAAMGDPVVIRIIDGIMAGFSGNKASSKNYDLIKGWGGTMVLGAGVAMAFSADSTLARAGLGALGGGAAGYHATENWRLKREKEQSRTGIEEIYSQAFDNLNTILNNNEINLGHAPGLLQQTTEQIQRLNRLLHGNAATADEALMVAALSENVDAPTKNRLRAEVENLVYQAYRRGIFAERALGNIENHSREATAEIPVQGKLGAWLRKNGIRAAGTIAGAAVGAGLAVLAGMGVQAIKEYYGLDPSMIRKQADLSKINARDAMAAVVANEVAHDNDLRFVENLGGDSGRADVHAQDFGAGKGLGAGDPKWDLGENSKSVLVKNGLLDSHNRVKGTDMNFKDWYKSELRRLGDLNSDDLKAQGINGRWGHRIHTEPGARLNVYVDPDGVTRLELGKGTSLFNGDTVKVESGSGGISTAHAKLAPTEFSGGKGVNVPADIKADDVPEVKVGRQTYGKMGYTVNGESGTEYTPLINEHGTLYVDPLGNIYNPSGKFVGALSESGNVTGGAYKPNWTTMQIPRSPGSSTGLEMSGNRGGGGAHSGGGAEKIIEPKLNATKKIDVVMPTARTTAEVVASAVPPAEMPEANTATADNTEYVMPDLKKNVVDASADINPDENGGSRKMTSEEIKETREYLDKYNADVTKQHIDHLYSGGENAVDQLKATEEMMGEKYSGAELKKLNNIRLVLEWQHELFGKNGGGLTRLLGEGKISTYGLPPEEIHHYSGHLVQANNDSIGQMYHDVSNGLPAGKIKEELSSLMFGYDDVPQGKDLASHLEQNREVFISKETQRLEDYFQKQAQEKMMAKNAE